MATATEAPIPTTKAGITADEFMKMDLGEGLFELVRGEVVAYPYSDYADGLVCGNVMAALYDFGRRAGHGYGVSNHSAVILGPDTVRGPDVAYYSQARWPRSRIDQHPVPVPPDLIVEVDSPGGRPAKTPERVAEYLAAGTLMVWVLHLGRRDLTVYRPDDPTPTVLDETAVIEDLPELPGFRCRVAEFFA